MGALRPYQSRFVASCLESLRTNSTLGVMPTGGGKTHSAAELIRQAMGGALPSCSRAAFWSPLREITEDTVSRFRAAGLDVGVWAAGHPQHPERPVQVVQDQTACRRPPPSTDLLVLDEAHLAEGAQLREALQRANPQYLLGITATPSRGDGKGLGATFQRLVMGPRVADLQAEGHLVPCHVYAAAPECFSDGLACTVAESLGPPVEGRRVLAFVADGRAKETCDELINAGWRAEVLAAETRPSIRRTQRERLTNGALQVLVTVDCATQGWDCPAVDVVVLARAVGVTGLYLQMVGRGLRPYPGKEACTVLDLRGCVWLHGLPEWPRVWSLEGEATGKEAERVRTSLAYCPGCGWIGAPPALPICPCCAGPLRPPQRPQRKRRSLLEAVKDLPPEEMRQRLWEGTYHATYASLMRAGKAQRVAEAVARKAADLRIERLRA